MSGMSRKERGYNPSEELINTTNTYVRRVEKIFKNLANPIEWLSFLHHGVPLLASGKEKESVSIHMILKYCFYLIDHFQINILI